MTPWQYTFVDIAGTETYRGYSSDYEERRAPREIADDATERVNNLCADGWEPFSVSGGYPHLRRQTHRASERRSGDPL